MIPKIPINSEPLTRAQLQYIEQLEIDCGFNRCQLIDAINLNYFKDKPVKFLDELKKDQASKVISYLKAIWVRNKMYGDKDPDDRDYQE